MNSSHLYGNSAGDTGTNAWRVKCVLITLLLHVVETSEWCCRGSSTLPVNLFHVCISVLHAFMNYDGAVIVSLFVAVNVNDGN